MRQNTALTSNQESPATKPDRCSNARVNTACLTKLSPAMSSGLLSRAYRICSNRNGLVTVYPPTAGISSIFPPGDDQLLSWIQAVVQRQQRMPAEDDDDRLLLDRQHRRVGRLRPRRQVGHRLPPLPLRHRLGVDPIAANPSVIQWSGPPDFALAGA